MEKNQMTFGLVNVVQDGDYNLWSGWSDFSLECSEDNHCFSSEVCVKWQNIRIGLIYKLIFLFKKVIKSE